MRAFDLFPERVYDRLEAEIDRSLSTGTGQVEVPLRLKNGETAPYEFVGNLVERPNGVLRLIGIGRDVTERKRHKRALQDRRQKALWAPTHPYGRKLRDGESPRPRGNQRNFWGRLEQHCTSEGGLHRAGRRCASEFVDEPPPEPRPTGEESIAARALRAGETVVEQNVRTLDNEVAYGDFRSVAATPLGKGGVVVLIFEAFRQELEGLGQGYEGTSLGLTITRQRVEAHGGDLEVESEKGEGSQFTATLPTGNGGSGDK